jgi:hypothetical protein
MFASMLTGITLVTQILKANFIQIGNELEDASRASGAGFLNKFFLACYARCFVNEMFYLRGLKQPVFIKIAHLSTP